MKVYINDEVIDVPEHISNLKAILDFEGIHTDGTAIALNDCIVPRSRWETTIVGNGDRIVAIKAAFGG